VDLLAPLSAVILTYREVSVDALGRIGVEMQRCMKELGPRRPMYVLHTCGRVEAYLYGAAPEEVGRVVEAYKRHVDSVQLLTGAEAVSTSSAWRRGSSPC